MKKSALVILGICLCACLFSHQQRVHQYLTREAFSLLRLALGQECVSLDEMESYLGFDETNLNGGCPGIGDGKIVSGAYMEDEYDIVYHYGWHLIPNYTNTPPWIEDLVHNSLSDNNNSHRTITHFWDADSGIEATTHLSDEMTVAGISGTWGFTIPENAMQKIERYVDGNFVERRIYPNLTVPSYLPTPSIYSVDVIMPDIVSIYHGIGYQQIVGYEDYLGEYHEYNIIRQWGDTAKPRAYNRLGRMCHLLQDMSVPAHAHESSHAGVHGMYSDHYENNVDDYLDSYREWTAAMVYDQVGGPVDPSNYDDPIYDMCYELNQMADHYADGRSNGDNDYDLNNDVLNTIIPTLGAPTLSTEVNDINCMNVFDNLIPQAIRYTAGYMLYFLHSTGQISSFAIGGNVSISDSSEQEFVSQVKVKLFNSSTHQQIMESHPDASGQFMLNTLTGPGSYYIEYGLSLPSLGYEYYPIRTEDFNLQIGDSPLFLPPVSLTRVQLNHVLVSTQSSYPCYESIGKAIQGIQAAVDSGYNNEAIVIKVLPGVYSESIDLSPLANGQVSSLTLKGWGEGVLIDPENTDYCIKVIGNCISNIIIENLTLTNAGGGVYVNLDNSERLTVKNCTISNCSSPNFRGLSISSNVPSTITDCEITNNIWIEDDQGEGSTAGLFLINNTSTPTIVTGCTISNNYAENISALYLSGSGHFDVKENTFCCNNPNWDYQNPDPDKYIICFDLVGSANFMNNLMLEEYCPSGIEILASGQGMSWINISNNTFNFLGSCISVSSGSRVKVINNIFSESITGIVNEGQNNLVHITNDAFYSTTPFAGITYNPVSHPGCLFDEELDLDNNFVPIWNSSTMSPCIDSGVGTDDDETPADIGAYPTVGHAHESYTMPTYGYPKWMSFPVLNRTTPSYDIAENFFAPIISNDILDKVIWKIGNNQQTFMYIDNYILHNGNTPVQSVLGYKVILRPEVTQAIEIPSSGFVQSPNTIINLYAHPAGSSTGVNENWIGYFLPQSSSPFTALASVLDKVTSIRTQYWSAIKGNGFWKVSSANLTLNYGDMVIITVTDDCSFAWGNEHPVDPKLRSIATAFEYEEKLDYTPMFIDLSGFDVLPSEIGLYVDGECKGAVKVEGNYTDLCAYLDKYEVINPEDCELVLYFDTKEVENVKQRCRLDSSDMKLMSEFGIPHYEIAIKAETELNPIISKNALSPNYPNPFNPETTISYEVASDGIVKLDIFNLKGQLVKTLVNENKVSGPHKVVWNGTDKYGRKVASGIYQYRLTTKDGRITKKMMLMK